jgi:hypothetical protein
MIGQSISHYRILEKSPTSSGQVGEGGLSQISPRTFCVTGRKFEDPRLPQGIQAGGQATKRPVRRSNSEGGSVVGGVI